jgi:hypothetical protein
MATHDKGNTSPTWIAVQQWFFGWVVVPIALGFIAYLTFFIFFYPGGFSAMLEMFDSGADEIFLSENAVSMAILEVILHFIGASASAIFLKKSYEIDSANYIAIVSTVIATMLMFWGIFSEETIVTFDNFIAVLSLVVFYISTRIFLSNDK